VILIDLTLVFVLPLTATLAAIFLMALGYDLLMARRRKRPHEAIFRCGNCRHVYTEPRRIPLSRCPECGNKNKPVRQ